MNDGEANPKSEASVATAPRGAKPVTPPATSARGTMYDMDPLRQPGTQGPEATGMLRRMLNRSGNSLFVAIEPLSDEEFFSAGPNGISVAWTVGHLACVFDLFTSWIHGGGCRLPKDIHDVFNSLDVRPPGGDSKAAVVEKAGHSKGEILYLLRTAQIRALKLLDATDPASWNAPPPGPHPENLGSIGDIWEHLAIHTYWHMGELCGTFSRFHGTYTLNMLPHYFYYLPTANERD